MNLHSSRSHCLYQLTINVVKQNSETYSGTLNMIDLAGSENSKIAGVEGARLEECKSINSSLSSLSNVFKAIKE